MMGMLLRVSMFKTFNSRGPTDSEIYYYDEMHFERISWKAGSPTQSNMEEKFAQGSSSLLCREYMNIRPTKERILWMMNDMA